MKRTRQVLFAVLLFVCPLIFFTNLTRNPYVTQICLLNLSLLLLAALGGLEGVLGDGMRHAAHAAGRSRWRPGSASVR